MKWTLETRKMEEVHENSINPRRMSKAAGEQLRESITKFGVCEPLVINQDGLIIGGHQRYRTLKGLGRKIVPVYVPDRILTAQEVEELAIRLNKSVGEWDFDCLANAWDADSLVEWGFSLEELGLDDPLPSDDEDFKATVTVSFDNESSLEEMLPQLQEVISGDSSVTYKTKRK